VRSLDRGREIAVPRRRPRELRAPKRGEPSRFRTVLRWFVPGRPADTIAVIVAAVAVASVLANALFLQPVPHPAPLFGEEPRTPEPAKSVAAKKSIPAAPAPIVATTPVPPPRPDVAAVRGRSELVLDIQRELANRGYYDGTVDGLPGPRTSQAIRDFEQAQGLKATGEPSDALLAHIFKARSRKKDTTGSVAPTSSVATADARASTRVLAVQRVLARLGYGPVKLSGLSDPATRGAIEQFERDRGMAKSGEISERLVAELAKVTGAPVE
jgi:peptidoglycan hydrolase-like protein with peptidoglycan-binding domain